MPKLRHADGRDERILRHGADGSKSRDYCSYCYDKGAFTADCTMEEMIEFCVKPTVENVPGMTEEGARAMMREHFPLLKRWQAKLS